MGNSMGQTRTLFTERMGRSIQVSADGAPKYKAGGITVNWNAIYACPADTGTYYGKTVANGQVEFEDGVVVKVGEKAIRYGSIMVYDSALDLDPTLTTGAGVPQGAYRLALTGDAALLAIRGNGFIVNETVLEEDTYSNHIGVMDGGRMWRARIVKSDVTQADTTWVAGDQAEAAVAAYTSATASVPPTLAQIEAGLPLVVWARDN
jgi:hypothetical protein